MIRPMLKRFAVPTVLALLMISRSSVVSGITPMKKKAPKPLPSRAHVIQIFERAILLNEDFKRDPSDHDKRARLEAFDEDILDPAFEDCVKLLARGNDQPLAVKLFDVVRSHENSADEQLSITLAEVFYSNPDIFESALSTFPKDDQEYFYGHLEWGWENLEYFKKKTDPRMATGKIRLKRLGERFRGATEEVQRRERLVPTPSSHLEPPK
jgi:hypothetical protein